MLRYFFVTVGGVDARLRSSTFCLRSKVFVSPSRKLGIFQFIVKKVYIRLSRANVEFVDEYMYSIL